MLLRSIECLFEVAQSHFDLMHRCDVCSHTGVLIPLRPDHGTTAQAPRHFVPIGASVAEFKQRKVLLRPARRVSMNSVQV
jgi:hypothetical protein